MDDLVRLSFTNPGYSGPLGLRGQVEVRLSGERVGYAVVESMRHVEDGVHVAIRCARSVANEMVERNGEPVRFSPRKMRRGQFR